jgi:OOP family OmpA-OmpF porin
MKRTIAFVLIALFCAAVPSGALAKSKVPEHPLIRPFPGSVLAENMSTYKNFDAHKFGITDPETNKFERKEVRGTYRRLLYEVRKEDGSRNTDISRIEFFENFKQAALEKGGKIMHESDSELAFTLPREDGGTTWCEVRTTSLGQTYLTIVDEKPFKKSLVFGPAQMKEALDKDGRVALYDILFDTDKATLKQPSDKQLQNVVTLLQKNPNLKMEVQGHTDSDGNDEYNMKLSQQRAETVVSYIELFGIGDGRLTPKGYGESKPVASNDSADDKAKNRRVELVKVK